MKKINILSALLILMILIPSLVNAQPPPPPTGPPCWPPPCVPVDNGVIFMILAVIGYGGKKLYDAKKQQELKTKAE